jgi:hypothetical protein
MQDIEQWRLDAGSAIYEGVASSASPALSVPGVPATSDPLAAPANLDGQNPVRGWEAVASSYFLATTTNDLHQPYPPTAFRVAYCLYNPDQPIESQTTTNAQGCSPERAWDEWDISSQSIFDFFGIDIGEITGAFGDFFNFFDDSIDLDDIASPIPFIVHHPENRELGIRQAQAGVARLALGIIVALFPIIEANISLMLALAASFIYLTLPVVLLFGFFLATESMTNRLLMQFVYVIIRTLIINGIVALFMLLLMNTAISGSLTAYLGLVGVGLIGGFFLARVAAATMKETLGQSMGALGSVWLGTTTGLLGNSVAQPAQTAMGMAKMGAAAVLLGAGGANSVLDLAETSYEGFRSGARDMRQGAPGTMTYLDRQATRLPASLARMAQTGLGADEAPGQNGQATDMFTALAAPLAMGALATLTPTHTTAAPSNPNGRPPAESDASGSDTGRRQTGTGPAPATPLRQAEVAGWLSQTYQAQQTQRGQKQATERGRDLLGEELAWKAERALGRHSRAEANTVLAAARKVAGEHERGELIENGRLTGQAITAVRDQLNEETAQSFSGQKGTWDLAALTAVALQQQTTASPEAFRQAVARAENGGGQDAPGQTVPRRLGLDPVAAGAHYPAINRFTRLSEEAGLSATQREQLLAEAQAGEISDETRAGIETSLQEQREQGRGQGLTSEVIIAGALALPATLSGPEQVWTTPNKSQSRPAQGQGQSEQKPGQTTDKKETDRPDPADESQQWVKPNEKRTVLTQTGGQVYQPANVTGQTAHLGQTLKSSLRDPSPAKPDQPVTGRPQPQSPQTETEAGPASGQKSSGKGHPGDGITPPPTTSSQNQSPTEKKSDSVKAGQTQPAVQESPETKEESAASPKSGVNSATSPSAGNKTEKKSGSPEAAQAQPVPRTEGDSAATAPSHPAGTARPIADAIAPVKAGVGVDPAPAPETTELGQKLNAGVKGQPAETLSNQAEKPARSGVTALPIESSPNQAATKKEMDSSKAAEAQPATNSKVEAGATTSPDTRQAAMPAANTVASVKSSTSPAPPPDAANNLGQELNASLKPPASPDPTSSSGRVEVAPPSAAHRSTGSNPAPDHTPSPSSSAGSVTPTPASAASMPDNSVPASSSGPPVSNDQIPIAPLSGQPVQGEPAGATAGNAAPKPQPMSRSPRAQDTPIGRTEFSANPSASTPATEMPSSIGSQAAPPVASGAGPSSSTTPSPDFGQALRSDQPAQPSTGPETPGHRATTPVMEPLSVPSTTQGQNQPPTTTPAGSPPVSPRTGPQAPSSVKQPAQPISDRSTPVASQVTPPPIPAIPSRPDAAVPSSTGNVPGSKSPSTPTEPPTGRADDGPQQKPGRAKSASSRRKPLPSPRQTGGQS